MQLEVVLAQQDQESVPRDPELMTKNLKPAPQPKSVPRKEVSLNNQQLAPKDAAALSFTFKELNFEGNAALTSEQLATLWAHKVGDTVTEGQTLMIVEAMKTMNPIPAPRAGKILEIIVANGQPVEFGEPLAIIG